MRLYATEALFNPAVFLNRVSLHPAPSLGRH